MKNVVFIHNNMKVCPYHIHDAAFPGFEVMSWEYQTTTKGTLYDMEDDAGFSNLGNYDVSGQVWVTENYNKIKELDQFMGIPSGKNKRTKTRVFVLEENETFELDCYCYILNFISRTYDILESGVWTLKREIV